MLEFSKTSEGHMKVRRHGKSFCVGVATPGTTVYRVFLCLQFRRKTRWGKRCVSKGSQVRRPNRWDCISERCNDTKICLVPYRIWAFSPSNIWSAGWRSDLSLQQTYVRQRQLLWVAGWVIKLSGLVPQKQSVLFQIQFRMQTCCVLKRQLAATWTNLSGCTSPQLTLVKMVKFVEQRSFKVLSLWHVFTSPPCVLTKTSRNRKI